MIGARSARLWIALLGLGTALLGFGGDRAEPGDTHWSFKPVKRSEVPAVGKAEQPQNPIDAFLLQALEAKGLTVAPEADRRTLIRRVTFDLIGLPPTPEEVESFERDTGAHAYERLVDRLLANPHYGERWGRHWLDLVRFAETHGYERDDPKPNAWRYRDWVVRALNGDLPYDRFLVEQLAGDELPDASPETRMATGFGRLGLIDDEPADPVMDRFDQLDDLVRTVGTTMLGLTIQCARCHDHKFDPIPQADYYRMLAFFVPSQPFVRDKNESITVVLATADEQKRHAELTAKVEAKVAQRQAEIDRVHEPHRQAILAERMRSLDNDTIAAIQTPADRRDDSQKALARSAEPVLKIKPGEIDPRLTPDEKARLIELERQFHDLKLTLPAPLPTALALVDASDKPGATRILVRGDAHHPGKEVEPGFLSAIDAAQPLITSPPVGHSTGRRLALARWIARADNPLTARVIVNRLWQHHFGQGLVATPSDFGAMGEEPSHPKLLDWLASEFVARGWSLKAMHRLMVTSAAYRRSGTWNDQAGRADPMNSLLWRMAPRRLEAEPIRDAALAVSGVLNLEIGGPSVTPPIDPAVLAGQSLPGNGWGKSDPRADCRRSLYVYVKRTLPLPELEVLDAPDNAEPCPRRAVTTTAPQALTLLNSAFWHDQAAQFAARLRREAGDDVSAQVDRAFALALARAPSELERQSTFEFLEQQVDRIRHRAKSQDRSEPGHEALRAFCLVLLNTNEFVTVD